MALMSYEREGKYGVATTFYFNIPSLTATSTDVFFTGAAPVAGEVKIVKDGGAGANTANLPVLIATSLGAWGLLLSATEMQASDIVVTVSKGTVYGACVIHIQTKLRLGQISVDATQIGGNANGVESTGVGTGHGWSGTAGASGKICNFMDTLEGTEPVTAVAANATLSAILQHMKRRQFNRVTSTVALMTIYRDDNSTPNCTMAVSDDGTTASKNRAA